MKSGQNNCRKTIKLNLYYFNSGNKFSMHDYLIFVKSSLSRKDGNDFIKERSMKYNGKDSLHLGKVTQASKSSA